VYHPNVEWYTFVVPTSRPRHQVTETPSVAHALDAAARRWPGEPRSKLLARLIHAGATSLQLDQDEAVTSRIAAIEASSGRYSDAYHENYLADLRQDWPA
jgi:hypothetical protein